MIVKCSNKGMLNDAKIPNDLADENNARLCLQQLENLPFILVLLPAVTQV